MVRKLVEPLLLDLLFWQSHIGSKNILRNRFPRSLEFVSSMSDFLSRASVVEQEAISMDRKGDLSTAIARYTEVAGILTQAVAAMPLTSPDTHMVLTHKTEVLKRIEYLKSILDSGQTRAAISVEAHIQPVQIGNPQTSPTSSSASAPRGGLSSVGTAAAIGGVTGLVLLGPITAVAGAAALAYGATRTDTPWGASIRGVARGTNAVVGTAADLNEKLGVTETVRNISVGAYKKTAEFNEKYGVTETVKTGVIYAGNAVGQGWSALKKLVNSNNK
jgi:hypothetical protein